MIPGLKKIHTHNIQSHKDVVIELPKTGIVAFTGNNSNGKSVIVKAINAILRNDLAKPKERRTLINRDSNNGYIELTRYDGMILLVYIHVEAAYTYAELTYPDGRTVKRFLADKIMPELIREFGLNYNKEYEVSLNVHNDDDKFLFVNTKHQANYAALNSALTDEYAENALTQLELVEKDLIDHRKKLESEYTANLTLKENLTVYDTEKCAELNKKLLYIAANIQHIPTEPCPKVKGVPNVITMPLLNPIKRVKYPLIINIQPIPEDKTMRMLGNDLNDVLKGVCPTCKRAFFS